MDAVEPIQQSTTSNITQPKRNPTDNKNVPALHRLNSINAEEIQHIKSTQNMANELIQQCFTKMESAIESIYTLLTAITGTTGPNSGPSQ